MESVLFVTMAYFLWWEVKISMVINNIKSYKNLKTILLKGKP